MTWRSMSEKLTIMESWITGDVPLLGTVLWALGFHFIMMEKQYLLLDTFRS